MSAYAEDYPLQPLDVSGLPESAMDSRDPVWWGNLLLILIETTSIALMIASYYYLKRNFDQWPPPRILQKPIIHEPNPRLLYGTINVILLALSCLPMYLTDMAARKMSNLATITGLLVMIVINAAAIYVRYKEYGNIYVRWDSNAYGSLLWSMLSLHMVYLLGSFFEFLIMLNWLLTHELEPHHALDITLCGGYWYWLSGIWVILYFVIYWSPRWMH